jgi:iron complex outermembrane receptor protein
MKQLPTIVRCTVLALAAWGLPPLRAQSSDDPPAAASDATVHLPSFTVSSEKDESYEGAESSTLTRTGVNIADIPQSVSIINKSFIEAVDPTELSQMIQFVAGAQMGNNPAISLTDRFTIRGFSSQGDFVDGFLLSTGGAGFSSMYYIDHIEVIKGPAAIMATNATGVVGGAVDKVSVNPTANQVDTLTVEVGRYATNQTRLDVGGALTSDGKLLWRLLALYRDQNDYYDWTYEQSRDIMPMLSYQFDDKTEVWVKAEITDEHVGNYNGIPLDGRTNQPLAVPPTTNFGENEPTEWRTATPIWRAWGQFTHRPNDHLAIRFAAFDSVYQQQGPFTTLATTGTLTPTLQPNGSYAFSPAVQYAIPPSYQPGQLINRSLSDFVGYDPHREIQNDYAFNFTTGPVSHKLLLGGSAADFPVKNTYWTGSGSLATVGPINPLAPLAATGNEYIPGGHWTSQQDTNQTYAKIFALETAGFFNDRLQFTYGVSRHRFDESSTTYSYSQITDTPGATTYVPDTVLYHNIVQYGVVAKPLPNVSLFYGQNSTFNANAIQNGAMLPPNIGSQEEAGIKTDIIPGRVNFSVSYFELHQLNNTTVAFPQTTPLTYVLIPGETSRGFDGDVNVNITKNLVFVGSFTALNAHVQEGTPYNLTPQPYGGKIHQTLPVDNVSPNVINGLLSYKFTENALKGVTIGTSVNWDLDKRAVTDNSNQVLFTYEPGYSVLNIFARYDTKHYRIQLNVDNVLNQFFWINIRNQLNLTPETPINPRLSITYKL